MNFSICLDQTTTPNFNVTNLSTTGFSIYSNLNLNSPLVQNIPYTSLFESPLGTCPFNLTNIPEGTDYLIVVDQCNTSINVSSIFAPENINAGSITIDCCYAIINLNPTPLSICGQNGCNLSFDTFSTSTVGQIIAGNLSSTCGVITDYTIGWYRNGNYSSPEFISGFGNAFLPYDNLHPLTGQQAVPCLAGDWEGIIHDIAIGGITYSSIAGTANGVPIPFESCFDTVVVNPLTCTNGPYSGSSKYSHQINYNSQAVGASPSPVSLTYVLDASVKYFAYAFGGFSIWDEIEIKWISGNPSATSNPSLYSQPIYLEKLRIGTDAENAITPTNYQLYESTYTLPGSYPTNIFDGQYSNVNNIWPKYSSYHGLFQRVLTLNTLETSSNPLFPDLLEITISPNPTNNNTQWSAGFQCLNSFDCTDCNFDNYPNQLPKISKLILQKIYGCDAQRLLIYLTSSCNTNTVTSDWMGTNIANFPGISNPHINLINSHETLFVNGQYVFPYPYNYIPLKDNTSCIINAGVSYACSLPSTGIITFSKSPYQIQLTFNLESDYLYYKAYILSTYIPTPIPCGGTSVAYYKTYELTIPVQGINANCGDNTGGYTARFHVNDAMNVVYNENPLSNFWSITIPQTAIINCYPPLECDTCPDTIQQFINTYNSTLTSTYSYTTNVGAKFSNPITQTYISRHFSGGSSGSVCYTPPNDVQNSLNYGEAQYYTWYSTHTLPFISSSTGWVNLPSLGAFLPCSNKTGSYPYEYQHGQLGLCYVGKIYGYQVRFPHLTSSGFNYSLSTNDFEIYTEAGYGSTGSIQGTYNISPPPCPDPLSSLIYRYSGSIATMYSSSYFFGGVAPTLVIDP
jgi:hypothetical protein